MISAGQSLYDRLLHGFLVGHKMFAFADVVAECRAVRHEKVVVRRMHIPQKMLRDKGVDYAPPPTRRPRGRRG